MEIQRNQSLKMLLTLMLLLLMLFSVFSDGLVGANPYIRRTEEAKSIPAPEGTKPPLVLVSAPVNGSFYNSNNITFVFDPTIPSNDIPYAIVEVYYRGDWQRSSTQIDLKTLKKANNYRLPSPITFNTENVPSGNRSLTINVVAKGTAYEDRQTIKDIYHTTYYVNYKIEGNSSVNFTVDLLSPKVKILSLENIVYSKSDLPLTFGVNEQLSKAAYSLNGQSNMSIAGNTTLSGLANGLHNITVYVWDMAGNSGVQKQYSLVLRSRKIMRL